MKNKAIVIGSGAGGAMAARELQGRFDVTVLEAGKAFKPFSADLNLLEKLKSTRMFLDERMIQFLFPAMKVHKTAKDFVIANGIGLGGTTTLSAANVLRYDHELKALGIHLDQEFEELCSEIPITEDHKSRWNALTKELFNICEEMKLNPVVTPKMIDMKKCRACGQCVLGCKYGAKWDSRVVLNDAVEKGVKVVTGCKAEKINIENGRAVSVNTIEHGRKKQYSADLIILAAGGLETPVILERSGIHCEASLFVDPLLCVAAPHKDAKQNKQIPMPFIVQQEHYMISPYFDPLSFFFHKDWKNPANDIVSMMIKLADTNVGSSSVKGIEKKLTPVDQERFQEAIEISKQILQKAGVHKNDIFLGIVNAGHPGGMLPLSAKDADTMHSEALPENLYVADATLFPQSLGNPPILTIMAIAKHIARLCIERY
jgi:choline dehydrogenase-like flavoprotein